MDDPADLINVAIEELVKERRDLHRRGTQSGPPLPFKAAQKLQRPRRAKYGADVLL
jgi:hypothetical protein